MSSLIYLSVIICSHNPRPDYLRRVLEALRAQSLPPEQWELLLVDNASQQPLSNLCDLSWHPNGRHVREAELGLTPARLRGIAEAMGEILVFVDDDNVLAPSYLQEAIRISREWRILGAWGGTIIGEFEVEPEPWTQSLLPYLGIREISKPIWSNNPSDIQPQPCGAGLCIRVDVAMTYAKQIALSPIRRQLDRVGKRLTSGGDGDLLLTSCDLGLGFGNFPMLRLTHLIPASRVEPGYLIRLMQEIWVSGLVMHHLRGEKLPDQRSRLRTIVGCIVIFLSQGRRSARIYKAKEDALRRGIRTAELSASAP